MASWEHGRKKLLCVQYGGRSSKVERHTPPLAQHRAAGEGATVCCVSPILALAVDVRLERRRSGPGIRSEALNGTEVLFRWAFGEESTCVAVCGVGS